MTAYDHEAAARAMAELLQRCKDYTYALKSENKRLREDLSWQRKRTRELRAELTKAQWDLTHRDAAP